MAEWVPIWVLPNLQLKEPIEGRKAALVPFTDGRVVALTKKYPRFKSYLGRFTDAFGVRQRPAILLTEKSKGKKAIIRLEAMASFRDLVVLSVIPHSRALMIVYKNSQNRIIYSNSFWIHPWMIDKDYQWLVTKSMASLGLHQVSEFKGQATPEIFSQELNPYDIDKALLAALIDRWHDRYYRPNPTWHDRALFRSLNMANVACQLPSVVDTTVFDIGRTLALWVSAFEILVHPGVGKSNLAAVYAALDKVSYVDRNMKRKWYRAYDPVAKKKTPATLPRFIYDVLYGRRNAFLHGNPVTPASLWIKGTKVSLLNLAPSLYRMALTSFLDLKFSENAPSNHDVKSLIEYRRRKAEFYDYQQMNERALLSGRRPKGKA